MFDPSLPTVRDRIRSIVGDITSPETLPDATYDAVIAEYDQWKLAAADMAERVAVLIEQDPTNYTDVGVMAVGWGDKSRSLRAIAMRLRAEVAAESSVSAIPAATSVQLARAGGSNAPEYRYTGRGRRW